MGVLPKYRRKGIGIFGKKAINYLFSLNSKPIRTATWAENLKSIRLFEKIGFKKIKTRLERRGILRKTVYS